VRCAIPRAVQLISASWQSASLQISADGNMWRCGSVFVLRWWAMQDCEHC